MSAALPPVTAPVLSAAVDALPNRLRRKLDDTVQAAAGWPISFIDNQYVVRVDDATTVTLTVADGMVTDPAQASCTCLLAPNCLHRTAVLARCPVADAPVPGPAAPGGPAGTPGDPSTAPDGAAGSAGGSTGAGGAGSVATDPTDVEAGEPLSAAQRAAAEHLWQAGVAVLSAGVSGAGVVLRTALLRATHEARIHGLHRAAAAGRQVAAHLHAARELQPQYRLGDLTDDLHELLAVARKLRDPALPTAQTGPLVGTARRRYDVRGSLRLYGLCSVPVIADSGYAGVITYVVDRDSRVWSIADLMPGGEERAARAGDATVALGEAALTHRALCRAGLVVSGATASDVGALGAGKAVRAVSAEGCAWSAEPLARLWAASLDEQVPRAFAALALPVTDRPAGADLLFLTVRVLGAGGDGVRVATADGTVLTLTIPSDHAVLPYRRNLALLAGAAGLDLLVVARPDPARPQTVHALAVAAAELALPPEWAGHLDLGFDRLRRKHFEADAATADGPAPADDAAPTDDAVPTDDAAPTTVVAQADDGTPAADSSSGEVASAELPPEAGHAGNAAPHGDLALSLVRRHAERVVAGGRAVQALAAADEHRLHAARLETGAALLRALTVAAQAAPRDAFGRPVADGAAAFADTWLSVAVYERAAAWALTEASWRPGPG